jgi:tRNA pseudouridine55 synthase
LLGGGAHLRRLRRTAVGPFTVAEARPPEECELLAPIEALRGMARIDVDAETAELVGHGRVFDAPTGDGPWAFVGPDDELLAVYERVAGGRAKPTVVIGRPG